MTSLAARIGSCLLGVLLVGAGLSLPAHAQEASVGAALGASFSTVSTDDVSTGYRTGFLGGVALRLEGSGPLSGQAEFGLAQRGTDVQNEEGELRYGATYLEMPVMLRLEAPSLGPVTPHAMAGGYGGVKFLERQSFGGIGSGVSIRSDQSFFRRFDAGAILGLGAAVETGTGEIEGSVRYGHGLLDVARAGTTDSTLPVGFPGEGRSRTWSVVFYFGL